MRNFNCDCYKWDKKFFLAFIIVLICATISGIVLYKPVISNIYFINFTTEYIYNVYNYKNSALLLSHILSDLIYLYLTYFICCFTKFKYLSLIFVFLRGIFFGIYVAVLFGVTSFGGAIVGIFVFIPSSLVSIALIYAVAEICKVINKKYSPFSPLVFSLADCAIYAVLINILFRIVIAIV